MKNKYFLLVMKFLMLMLMFQPASSQEDLDYRFKYKNIGIRDFAPNYGPYYAGAAADIATYTGLTFYLSSNQTWLPPYSGDVAFEEADYGANGHIGLSEVYNLYHQPCVDPRAGYVTSNCSWPNWADYAVIKFNTHYLPSPTAAQRNNLLRHEFAHVLGLGHGDCTPSLGVMAPSVVYCFPVYTTYQPAEAALLDSWY